MKNCRLCGAKGKLIKERVKRKGKEVNGFRIECGRKSCGAAVYLVTELMWFLTEKDAIERWDKGN